MIFSQRRARHHLLSGLFVLALAACGGGPTAATTPTLIPASATALPTVLLASPTPPPPPTATVAPLPPGPISAEDAERLIADQAHTAITALQQKDLAALAQQVHLQWGLRFTPYPYVQETDRVFAADQVAALLADPTVYEWGFTAGEGGPITLTPADYWARYVYNHDFANPEQMSYNTPLGAGTMINNSAEFYPQSIIVEYYFSGFDPQFGGLDWQTLRLVFQADQGVWYLVGIIHGEWTT